jgi:5-methyltetrahydropteroyltriglutamate--homocysteine methyltransferase
MIGLRADHVGSLLRPAALLRARAEGKLSIDQLREAEDRAILAALEMQRQAGLQIFTDGEFRRGTWLGDMAEAVEGFIPASVSLEW